MFEQISGFWVLVGILVMLAFFLGLSLLAARIIYRHN